MFIDPGGKASLELALVRCRCRELFRGLGRLLGRLLHMLSTLGSSSSAGLRERPWERASLRSCLPS